MPLKIFRHFYSNSHKGRPSTRKLLSLIDFDKQELNEDGAFPTKILKQRSRGGIPWQNANDYFHEKGGAVSKAIRHSKINDRLLVRKGVVAVRNMEEEKKQHCVPTYKRSSLNPQEEIE